MARPGKLDRYITIQTPSDALDDYGQRIETYSTFAQVWADRIDLKGSERFDASQRLAVKTARFRIHWLSGLKERMRIIDDGTTYDITGIAEDRRENWAELSAEATNPEPVGSGEA